MCGEVYAYSLTCGPMKRPRQVISKSRFFSESSESDVTAIVPSFARISELTGCCCIVMSFSLPWFVIVIPPHVVWVRGGDWGRKTLESEDNQDGFGVPD